MECAMITSLGRIIDPTGNTGLLRLQDLAWSLQHTYRWAGMANPAVTVLQHSMAMARHYLAPGETGKALKSLLHDAAETLWRDMAYRIKYQEGMVWYREQEKACSRRIILQWAPWVADLDIKDADNGALIREMMDRFPDTQEKAEWLAKEAELRPGTVPLDAKHYDPKDDCVAWLRMYGDLVTRYATENPGVKP